MIKSIRADHFTLKCDKCESNNAHVGISTVLRQNDWGTPESYIKLTIKCLDCGEKFATEY